MDGALVRELRQTLLPVHWRCVAGITRLEHLDVVAISIKRLLLDVRALKERPHELVIHRGVHLYDHGLQEDILGSTADACGWWVVTWERWCGGTGGPMDVTTLSSIYLGAVGREYHHVR